MMNRMKDAGCPGAVLSCAIIQSIRSGHLGRHAIGSIAQPHNLGPSLITECSLGKNDEDLD